MENEDNDPIGKSLGLQPVNDLKTQIVTEINNLEDDILGSKHNIKELIFKGTEALEDLIDVAKQSQHPRAFEVVSTLINTLVSANKDLADITLKTNTRKEVNNDNRQIHNNYTFVGTATDLLKMMKSAEKDAENENK